MKRIVSVLLTLIFLLCPLLSARAETPEWIENGWEFYYVTMKGPDEKNMAFNNCLYRVSYTGKQITPEVKVYVIYTDANGDYHTVEADEKDYTCEWEEGRIEPGCYDFNVHYADAYGNVMDRTAFFSIMPNPPAKIEYGYDWPNVVFTWPETPGTDSFVFMQYDEATGKYKWLDAVNLKDEDMPYYGTDRHYTVTGLEKGKTYYFAVRPGPHLLFEPEITEIEITIPMNEADMKPAPLLPGQTAATTTTITKATTTTTTAKPTTVTTGSASSSSSTSGTTITEPSSTESRNETQTTTTSTDVPPQEDKRVGGWQIITIVLGALVVCGGATVLILLMKKKT